ncbi:MULTISPECIES: arginine--tRNA ligase [unclassified Leptolyngbya]|uniref:arginine--tRNA ligase n=1 Tax=unclassified Leptolyngbya TaxID=2650499 RepID=UPI001682B5BD|nr:MULTISPECIES: arginine--tRNA ligase [unclassified Leptolyngbya]MBD1909955.1 arginine--tRNA ligase [Leptolyngbya sp. FACHB-8]MBD2159060.1 arginine--tRNA ligase [Leptolyngbya sp. FACHB-16]
MISTIAQLNARIEQALIAAFGPDLAGTDPMLVPASNSKFGDYQSNLAMSLAKRLGQAPRAIAEQIVQNIDVSDLCETPTIAGPGFINFRLTLDYLEQQLQAIRTDSRLGVEPLRQGVRAIVDYPSPNIAKEMHVGHLRPSVIGDCLARIHEFLGYDLLRISHLGDWGTPFGMLIAYLREAYPDALKDSSAIDLGDLASFYRAAKKRFDEDEKFQEVARQSVVELQAGDPETLRAWQIVCDLSNSTNQKIFDLMKLSPLILRGESFYNPFLPDVITELDKLGLLVEDQGAQCVFLEGFTNKEGKPLPMIVQKSGGGYNYATTDLAAIRYRVNVDKVHRVVYPVGAEQANHFAQIFQVGKRAGWITDQEFLYAPLGSVLGDDGKKLKSRSGDAARLMDLLEEAIAHARQDLETRFAEEGRQESEEFIAHAAQVIGISAIKYADLSQNRTSNYIFSFDKMLALQGNTAPYMLYAYVRIQGISRKGNVDFDTLGVDSPISLQEETELALAKHILQLDETLLAIDQDLLPNRLCQYLFELSQKFNQFYDRCPVLQAEEPLRTSRLILCDLTAQTIKLGLSLLGISVLERM